MGLFSSDVVVPLTPLGAGVAGESTSIELGESSLAAAMADRRRSSSGGRLRGWESGSREWREEGKLNREEEVVEEEERLCGCGRGCGRGDLEDVEHVEDVGFWELGKGGESGWREESLLLCLVDLSREKRRGRTIDKARLCGGEKVKIDRRPAKAVESLSVLADFGLIDIVELF